MEKYILERDRLIEADNDGSENEAEFCEWKAKGYMETYLFEFMRAFIKKD